MVSHIDGTSHNLKKVKELEHQNMLLRFHNLRLLEQLEKLHPPDGMAVLYVQVQNPREETA